MKSLVNFFKKLFGLEHEIDKSAYIRAIARFRYHDACTSSSYIHHITNVRVMRDKNIVTVYIRTHIPGILIGKGGSNINGLKSYIEFSCNSSRPVEIYIEEETMFNL